MNLHSKIIYAIDEKLKCMMILKAQKSISRLKTRRQESYKIYKVSNRLAQR